MSLTVKHIVKIHGIPAACRFTFRDLVEHRALIKAFKARAGVIHMSAKGRSYINAFREFKKLYQPTEWYCRTAQGPHWKDDSIEIWYTRAAKVCIECGEAIEYLADFPGPRCLKCHAKRLEGQPLERPDFTKGVRR